jgi:crossover junction endodeoxyribonuclease RusA
MRIVLPWPPKELSPNARVHWATLAKLKRQYREACRVQTLAQGSKEIQHIWLNKPNNLNLAITFFPPTRRAYDLDNALARCKAGLDGLADALGVDDKHWSISIAKSEKIGGMVVVEIEEK